MIPFRTPFFLPWIYDGLLWRVPTQEKVIYLTFDDGPVPGPTEFVLDTLRAYEAQATFFCIGDNVRKHPAIFHRVKEEGHLVGNHTFHHVKAWSTSDHDYIANVQQCEHQLSREAGSELLFRPPYGQITKSKIRLLSNYRVVMWDVLTQDYNAKLQEERCLRGSIGATRPGSIVVFHDSIKAEKNLTFVLPRFIKHFQEQGYRFESLRNV